MLTIFFSSSTCLASTCWGMCLSSTCLSGTCLGTCSSIYWTFCNWLFKILSINHIIYLLINLSFQLLLQANLHLSGQFLTFEWKVHRYLSYYRNIKTQFFWFEQTAKDTEQTSKYKILPTTNQTKLSCMKNFHCKNLPKPIVNGEKAPQTCCSLLTNFGINSVKAAGVGR